VLPNGDLAVFDSAGGTNGDEVWVGSSLAELELIGEAVPEPDGGGILDGDTIHYYTEDSSTGDSVSSETLLHYTIPWDDLTNPTSQGVALDASGKSWLTGDPEFIEVGGSFYMFFDIKGGSLADYRIGVAVSDDLYNWTIIEEKGINKNTSGADMTVTKFGGSLKGATEFTDRTNSDKGVGIWDIQPIAHQRTIENLQSVGAFSDETANRSGGIWYQNTTGRDLFVKVHGSTSDTTAHTQILDANDSETGFNVDEVTVTPNSSGEIYTVSATVPDGFYYRWRTNQGFFNVDRWLEQ